MGRGGEDLRPGSGVICHILLMGMQTRKGIETTMINIVTMRAKNILILRSYPAKDSCIYVNMAWYLAETISLTVRRM